MERWEGKNDELCEKACEVYDRWEDEGEGVVAEMEPGVAGRGTVFQFGLSGGPPEGGGFDFGGGAVGAGAPQGAGSGRGRGVSNNPAWMS